MIKDKYLAHFRRQLKRLGFESIDEKLLPLYYLIVFDVQKARSEWPKGLDIPDDLAHVLLYVGGIVRMGGFKTPVDFADIFEHIVKTGVEDIKNLHKMTQEELDTYGTRQSLVGELLDQPRAN